MLPPFIIIIPVYNGLPYLPACISSVLAQTHTHWHLVILDSGSTDGSLEYVHSLGHPKIDIVEAPHRLSITENWARIASLPHTGYATILGQDDLLEEDFLRSIAALIEAHPRASLFTTHFRFVDGKGNFLRACQPMQSQYQVSELLDAMLQLKLDITATGYVFHLEDYRKEGGIPLFANLLFSDYALWMSLSRKGYLAVHTSEQFVFRLHQNTSQSTSGLLYLQALEQWVDFLKDWVEKNDSAKKILQQQMVVFVRHFGQMITHRILGLPPSKRCGVHVGNAIQRLNELIAAVGGISYPGILANPTIRLARIIDLFPPLRWCFWQWKRMVK